MSARWVAIALVCAAALGSVAQAAPKPRVVVSIKSQESDLPAFSGVFEAEELRIEKVVPWRTDPDSTDEKPEVQFSGPPLSRLLQGELNFDQNTDLLKVLAPLEALAKVDEKLKRPPQVVFVWGSLKFDGVIESLGQRYTMFNENGHPVRGRITITLRQADGAAVAPRECRNDGECPSGEECFQGACRPRTQP